MSTPSEPVVREPRAQDALPGELKPLEWFPERGPITDEEALGVARRRRRVELAGHPKSSGPRPGVPDALPAVDATKKASLFRLPAREMVRAHARAELEGIPLTAIIEELIRDYAAGAPQDPAAVQERLTAKGILRRRR